MAYKKRNWLLVADIDRNVVKELIRGPEERGLEKETANWAEKLFEKRRQLLNRFPPEHYDVIIAQAQDIDSLRMAFPEFTGWDKAEPKPLS